MKLAREHI